MLQDIYPHKLNNQYDINAIIEADDYVVCLDVHNNTLLNKSSFETGELVLPNYNCFNNLPKEDFIYLFTIDEERFFLYNKETLEAPGYEYFTYRQLRDKKAYPKHRIFGVFTAKHLNDWYRDNKFCGRCGKIMVHSLKERACVCSDPECKYTSYPRIMPAVIVGVINGDKILITRYRTGFAHNALIAGFTEIGETAEETVAREVMEEAGVKVKNIRYYKSQPWGMPNDLLLGFYCELDGDSTIKMDSNELKYADWVAREDIVLQPDDFSLTNEMMYKFKNNEL